MLEKMGEIKEEEGETVRVELSLLVIVGHINKKDECGNEDRGVYS